MSRTRKRTIRRSAVELFSRHSLPCAFLSLFLLTCSGLLAGCTSDDHTGSHAVADDWTPVVVQPEFQQGQGPVVMVDSAHGNWHTIDGRFAVFAQLLENDGYQVRSAEEKISSALLDEAGVFVVANAVKGGEDSEWSLPTPPALEPAEIRVLVQWVELGGSLLLIADHMPFPGSVAQLADAFGVVFLNGFAKKSFDKSGTLTFSRSSGALMDHPVSRGRTELEEVWSIKSFTGQAFRFVVPGEPLMVMPDDWAVFLPQDAFAEFDASTPVVSARGLIQGGVLRHGEGRVAVFGEASMFTAQAVEREDGEIVRFGMNDPEAADNAQFVLNVMHWLSGLLDD